MSQNPPITHIDLFAGPGGICTGFRSAGIKTVLAVEFTQSCCDTYFANHPTVKMLHKDIRKVSDRQVLKELHNLGLTGVDIVSAGFPCETFSTAGSRSRVYQDHRNFLYQDAIRIADIANAKILMLENVPAFMSKRLKKGSSVRILDLLINDLKSRGFNHFDHDVLNAADYGVPQKRRRFILLASKTVRIDKTMFNGLKHSSKVSVRNALSDLPVIQDNSISAEYRSSPRNDYQRILRNPTFWGEDRKTSFNLTYHISPKHRPGTLKRFALIRPGEGLKDLFDRLGATRVAALQAKRVLPNKWFISRNQRLIAGEQSHTVTSHCLEEIVHPDLDRGLSVREVARLQSFPDHYDFKGGPIIAPHIHRIQDKYEQIGDAVPPLLARHLGNCVVDLLQESEARTSSNANTRTDNSGIHNFLPTEIG